MVTQHHAIAYPTTMVVCAVRVDRCSSEAAAVWKVFMSTRATT